MIANVRSYKKNQVSQAEILTAISRFREEYKIKHVTAALGAIEEYDGDIWLADDDLHIPGDLDLTPERAPHLLVVLGDLAVDGVYGDSDDPESFLLVTGNMQARDVVTAGWLEVHGDLSTDRLIGDYNDCSAYIGGDVHAQLFYGEEHHFTIGGALSAGVVIGRPRLEIATPPAAIGTDDLRILEHFDRDLLCVFNDHDKDGNAITWVDGFRDPDELKRRVYTGLPFRVAETRDN
ncbi:hypothetical protein ACH4MN_06970 [Streptomyces anulatus]|uniref:hypothetical protein n=1 Tax=Streptomyces TaxID=1883 RepID=UPI001B397B05|nr:MULTISPECIES: hypothetical protein [unclassified Streptomyces]MBQ1105052.1 hypothetical protein [Streptomyces sp. 404i]MBQ1111331.1 hypothetical protein [Streptomyces sp. C3-3]